MYTLTTLQQKQVSGGNDHSEDNDNFTNSSQSYYQNIYINNSIIITNSSLNSAPLDLTRAPLAL